MKEDSTWKNRVEFSLDNRQIFMLFFASLVIVSLVFALGVVVGKRFNQGLDRPQTTDPLALLDQMGNQENFEENLTFHERLTQEKVKADPKPAEVDKTAAETPSAENKAQGVNAAEPNSSSPSAKSVEKETKPIPAQIVSKNLSSSGPIKDSSSQKLTEAKQADEKSKAASTGEETAGGDNSFTLQISAFQDKKEAELFMQKLRANGLKPFLITSDIPGKGIWYRVRMGRFKTWDAALEAKENFEKQQKIIAYVSKN